MQFMRKSLPLVFLTIALVAFTGCDKAEQALQGTDLGASADITKLVSKAVDALGGIKDLESAQAALPALKDVDLDLGKVVEKVQEMSPEQKDNLAGVVTKALPALEGAMGKVKAIEGVGSVVGPTLDSLKNKLHGLI